jgi:hypothetical protein
MPKSSGEVKTLAQTIPFRLEQAAWLKEEAKTLGSVNEAVRRCIEDARTMYALPAMQVEKLEADARARGMDRREYMKHLLALRYEALIKGEVEKLPGKAHK